MMAMAHQTGRLTMGSARLSGGKTTGTSFRHVQRYIHTEAFHAPQGACGSLGGSGKATVMVVMQLALRVFIAVAPDLYRGWGHSAASGIPLTASMPRWEESRQKPT